MYKSQLTWITSIPLFLKKKKEIQKDQSSLYLIRNKSRWPLTMSDIKSHRDIIKKSDTVSEDVHAVFL